MEVKLTYYGHSTFMLSNGKTSIVFDPFFNGNTWEKAKPEDIKCQYIFISHGHGDHYGDADLIGKANDALVISTAEVAHKAEEAGLRAHAMHLGGKHDFEFGSIRLTPAFHGAGIPGGHAAGVIVTFYGKTLYFAGDTAFFSDMQYLNRFGQLDYALLPIGDNFTMGPEDALLAASLIKADVTIPIHYKTWPVIDEDPDAFVAELKAKHNQKGLVVEPGSTITL
ncbi:MAG: metal-dependent hydrolase [Veillonella sp.]|uniref:metal-dependent hydrolase n=1 Tax=Veillonella sp. TaxID=1926307 RepID=UPI0025FF3C6C|nr:metal-dependent hydrolase [Veillonella sp.]MBE6080012.1 metal-dependent hydrolase [Veillonella sp.]